MRRLPIIAMACSLAFPACADGLRDQVLKCFSPPISKGSPYEIAFDVTVADGGAVRDLTVQDGYKAHGSMARAVGEALRRAVLKCQPFQAPAGTYKIQISSDDFDQNIPSLNPFKGAKPAPGYED